MKITLDTKTGICKIGSKEFKEAKDYNQSEAINELRKFIIENSKLNDYEEDCMWMSYRYCIGRHTIASSMHAGHIWENCKNRMSKERQLFTAYDINREIENHLSFSAPYFHFPITSLNEIYIPAIDIVCKFIEDNEINSIEDFIKYRDIYVKFNYDTNDYSLDVVTWEEYLRPKVLEIVSKYYGNDAMSADFAWKYFERWQLGEDMKQEELVDEFKKLTSDMSNKDNYYMHDFEDLFVWNDLVHCFDYKNHHKSILIDGTECEWFWTWTNKTEQHEDGYYYRTFGYEMIRVPVNKWNGSVTIFIPNESIKEDIY